MFSCIFYKYRSIHFFYVFFSWIIHFSLFLPLPFREKSERPEKAHSSLYSLVMNLDNSFEEQGNGEDGGFPCYACVSYTQHNSGALPHPIFHSSGSPDPITRNKDKFGRLRSLCPFEDTPVEPKASKMVLFHERKDKYKNQKERQMATVGTATDVGFSAEHGRTTRWFAWVVWQRQQP